MEKGSDSQNNGVEVVPVADRPPLTTKFGSGFGDFIPSGRGGHGIGLGAEIEIEIEYPDVAMQILIKKLEAEGFAKTTRLRSGKVGSGIGLVKDDLEIIIIPGDDNVFISVCLPVHDTREHFFFKEIMIGDRSILFSPLTFIFQKGYDVLETAWPCMQERIEAGFTVLQYNRKKLYEGYVKAGGAGYGDFVRARGYVEGEYVEERFIFRNFVRAIRRRLKDII